jgi:hypothetical protein
VLLRGWVIGRGLSPARKLRLEPRLRIRTGCRRRRLGARPTNAGLSSWLAKGWLVTLFGSAGVSKTRLVTEVACQVDLLVAAPGSPDYRVPNPSWRSGTAG